MIRKLIDRLLRWALILLLLLLGLLFYLLFTESGSRNIEKLAMNTLPQLQIENPAGRIFGDYRIGKFKWQDASVTAVAEAVDFQGAFGSLLQGEFVVRKLDARSVSVELHDSEQVEQQPAKPFEMPIAVRVEEARIDSLVLGMQDGRYQAENISLKGELAGSNVDKLLLELKTLVEGRPLALRLAGRSGLNHPFPFDLEMSASGSDSQFGTVESEAKATGSLKQYIVKATARGASEQYGNNTLRVSAKGDLAGVQLESVNLDGDSGSADLVGILNWEQGIEWQGDLKIEKARTAMLFPDYPAELSGSLASKGRLVDGKPEFSVELREITGKLHDYPVVARGMATFGKGQLMIRKLEASTGDNRIQADGTLGDAMDLTFDIDATKLSQLLPELSGSLLASGTLAGNFEKPQVKATLDGKKLAYAQNSLESLALKLSSEGEKVTATGRLEALRVGDRRIATVELDGKGTPGEHGLAIKATHELVNISTKLEGGWHRNYWQGKIRSLAVDERKSGEWTLEQPVDVTASAKRLESGVLCLRNAKAVLCSSNRWESKTGLVTDGKARDLPLTLVHPYLPPTVRILGSVNGDYKLTLSDGKPVGGLSLNWPNGTLTLKDAAKRNRSFGFDAGKIEAVIEHSKVRVTGGIRLPGYADIDAAGDIDLDLDAGRHIVDADLEAKADDITWLDEFIPEAQLLKGSLRGSAQLAGPLASPAVKAELFLADGQLRIDRTGETLDDIKLTLRTITENRFGIVGSLRVGKGDMNVNGDLTLVGKRWSSRLEIKGAGLALLDSHEVKVQVSPDIVLEANPEKIVMNGSVLVPEAQIRLTTLPKSAVAESGDVVIVGRGKPKRRPTGEGLGFEPRLKVILGDKVTFSGYGLDARLKGEFRLSQVKRKLITDGFLNVLDGVYKVYGQTLEIDSGQLIFNGPLDNPGIVLRIVRKVDDVTVGLNVNGTLQLPESSIFSTPPLSETEAFSYLLTGRSLSGASAVQGAMLMNVAKRLGLEGGGSFVRKLGNGLGLDEASISTDRGFEESELLLGKRIGDDLYVKYIIGLIDGLQKLAVEYRFNERLRAEAETGLDSSVDLIYRIERD